MSRSGFQSRQCLHPDFGYGNPTCKAPAIGTYGEFILSDFIATHPLNEAFKLSQRIVPGDQLMSYMTIGAGIPRVFLMLSHHAISAQSAHG